MNERTPRFRRGGRPRKTDSEKRRLLIAARVRPDELAIIEGRAAEANFPLSDFLREQALTGVIIVRRSRRLSPIDRHDLARIGSNLNQIARACNTTGDTFRARHIEATLEELRGLLRRIDAPG
ncbi:MobC family plasmid mobilization relaxosome protein [Methylocapsa sp. D3K7]|uniref:MobC family plasmid mobilization relaxosome protein n=1 Tax=Methylocapsa sp. D3K7 TaxID=3041435 RepID=UPI00244ED1D5|nr:MobC family plasmid mobilization relaxosome protein [Methylocapsa sp. D3K7]WGJ13270.1 MobC family plasmid mobilization relaxosome protein [Methylocapsa sp. D3K7]